MMCEWEVEKIKHDSSSTFFTANLRLTNVGTNCKQKSIYKTSVSAWTHFYTRGFKFKQTNIALFYGERKGRRRSTHYMEPTTQKH